MVQSKTKRRYKSKKRKYTRKKQKGGVYIEDTFRKATGNLKKAVGEVTSKFDAYDDTRRIIHYMNREGLYSSKKFAEFFPEFMARLKIDKKKPEKTEFIKKKLLSNQKVMLHLACVMKLIEYWGLIDGIKKASKSLQLNPPIIQMMQQPMMPQQMMQQPMMPQQMMRQMMMPQQMMQQPMMPQPMMMMRQPMMPQQMMSQQQTPMATKVL